MKIADEFTFTLSKPIKYAHKGNQEEGQLLILRGPSARNNKDRIKLQQGFFRAVNSIKRPDNAEASGGESQEIKGPEILALMLSSDIDMVEYSEDFRRLVCSGVCLIEGREPLTPALYDMIDPNDMDQLLGEYLAFFILSSSLKTLQKR